jgi:serine/threonine protein kinase/Tol biopolymer transport system component
MQDLIGSNLGHYLVVEQIGEGGMGEVYRAHDERLDRDVAVKVLPESVAQDEERLARFEREAKLLASLSHPNVATLHGLEEHEGQRFLVMELVEGESLASVHARGAIPVDETLPIALQIAEGLEAAHEQGIIHRDLKPANVMVSAEGKVKVLDFGLAKAFDPEGSGLQSPESLAESPTLTADLTRGGVLLGTAAYMSPEQARGKPVDKRADIWAFGCTLFEMLTGTRPFGGTSSTDVLAAIIKEEPEWDGLPAETPRSIRRLLRRCLTKGPRDRLHDIADARIELQSLPIGDQYETELAITAGKKSGWRTWLPWGVAAVLAVALIAAVVTESRSDGRLGGSMDVVRTTIDLPPGTEFANIVARRLWNGPMRNELALSPDGRTLVFSVQNEGGGSPAYLHRRPMDLIEAEVIPGTEGASSPFFSPDGRWVAFWAGGELKKVSLDGGLPITLAEYRDPTGSYPNMGGTWSPDGSIIIGCHLAGLQRVGANGGQLVPLTVPDRATEYAHRLPQVLPGGRAVLFTVAYGYTGAGGHIEVVSLDTGERKTVVDSGLDGRFVPTGHLLFLQQGTLMAASFDLDRLELTGRPVPVLEGVVHATNLTAGWANSGAGLLTVSDNGTLIFAPGDMAPDPQRGFVWVDRNGRTQPVSALPEGSLGFPRVSPDGRWLAFGTGGLNRSVWVHDLARGTTTRLTNEGRAVLSSWTPDTERLVIGYSQGGVGNLHRLSYRGNEPLERLSSSEFLQQPGSWSPDGRYLAYVQWRHSEGTDIWLLDMESRQAEPFLDTEYQYSYPDISPDGRWLVYGSDESGRDEVWVTSFPGRKQQMLVSNDGGIAPVWSPDGREIYYLSGNRLMVVEAIARPELTLGIPHTLIEVPRITSGPLRGYDITPDGTRFIFPIDEESEPITPPVRQLQVIINWFEELERLAPKE